MSNRRAGEAASDCRVLDLFAGPGGWSEGLRTLGLRDLGIEWDDAACATRHAAGHRTVKGDVSLLEPSNFAPAWGLIASPPCQDFSLAGKQVGIKGERGELMLEVPRWVSALRPTWIACEQVPPAVDIYRQFARWFEEWGYSTWVGILNVADYGVPQHRERAFLMAHLHEAVSPPEPTHAERPQEALFGPSLRPWVSMYEAVGWGYIDRPAMTIMSATEKGGRRCFDAGSGSWEIVRQAVKDGRFALPTWHDGRNRGLLSTAPNADAAKLMGFPDGYPFQGNQTEQARQIGNAVCPPVAAAVVGALTGRSVLTERVA